MNDSGHWGSSWGNREGVGNEGGTSVTKPKRPLCGGCRGVSMRHFCPRRKPPLQISYCNRPWYSVASACAQPRPPHFPFLLSALTSFGTVTLNSHIMQTASSAFGGTSWLRNGAAVQQGNSSCKLVCRMLGCLQYGLSNKVLNSHKHAQISTLAILTI